jgi:hypothetical protein
LARRDEELLRTLERPRERPRDGDATLGGMADNTTDGARKFEAEHTPRFKIQK